MEDKDINQEKPTYTQQEVDDLINKKLAEQSKENENTWESILNKRIAEQAKDPYDVNQWKNEVPKVGNHYYSLEDVRNTKANIFKSKGQARVLPSQKPKKNW